MSLFHPSKKDLISWFKGESQPKVEGHLKNCDRCTSVIEKMDSPAADIIIEEVLTEVLGPNKEFVDQLEGRVLHRIESREILTIMSGIFASGIETTRILVTEETSDIS